MKLTDLAVIFELFLICLLVVVHVRGNQVHGELLNRTMYNNVMDGIVEDALQAGYKSVNSTGEPVVDLEELKSCFMAETELYEKSGEQVLIYVGNDGFYCCESTGGFLWSDKNTFPLGKETAHEEKVLHVVDFLKLNYGIDAALPLNDGESWVNTVGDYSLLAISYDISSGAYCFSGAMLHKK